MVAYVPPAIEADVGVTLGDVSLVASGVVYNTSQVEYMMPYGKGSHSILTGSTVEPMVVDGKARTFAPAGWSRRNK